MGTTLGPPFAPALGEFADVPPNVPPNAPGVPGADELGPVGAEDGFVPGGSGSNSVAPTAAAFARLLVATAPD